MKDKLKRISRKKVFKLDVYLSTKSTQGFGEDNGDLDAINVPIIVSNDSDISESNSKGSPNLW
jgi:hypothetical protein